MTNYASRVKHPVDLVASVMRLERWVTEIRVRMNRMSQMQNVDGSAAPVTGTWKLGDKVWNTAPSSGGYIGWVCTAAGTPGTWKGFGVIA